MAGRFIKLYDKILNWEWYSDINTFRLFVHLLLKANYKESRFDGRVIERGQLVTSLPKLAADTRLTIRQLRGSLDKLISTGEVTNKSFTKYRVITIVRYDDYQSDGRQNGRQTTDKTADKGQTNDRQNGSKYRNIEQIEKIEHKSSSKTMFIPPTAAEVEAYCDERGVYLINSQAFVDYYASRGWVIGKNGQRMKDWKAAVRLWEQREKKRLSDDDSDMPY